MTGRHRRCGMFVFRHLPSASCFRRFSGPEGRQTLAHGVSRGRMDAAAPHPGPLPAGEGGPGSGGCGGLFPRLAPWAKIFRPFRGLLLSGAAAAILAVLFDAPFRWANGGDVKSPPLRPKASNQAGSAVLRF